MTSTPTGTATSRSAWTFRTSTAPAWRVRSCGGRRNCTGPRRMAGTCDPARGRLSSPPPKTRLARWHHQRARSVRWSRGPDRRPYRRARVDPRGRWLLRAYEAWSRLLPLGGATDGARSHALRSGSYYGSRLSAIAVVDKSEARNGAVLLWTCQPERGLDLPPAHVRLLGRVRLVELEAAAPVLATRGLRHVPFQVVLGRPLQQRGRVVNELIGMPDVRGVVSKPPGGWRTARDGQRMCAASQSSISVIARCCMVSTSYSPPSPRTGAT
jgi:hypothetical protein